MRSPDNQEANTRQPGCEPLITRLRAPDNQDAVPWQPGCEPLTTRMRSPDSHDAVFWQPGCGPLTTRMRYRDSQDVSTRQPGCEPLTTRLRTPDNQDANPWLTRCEPLTTRMRSPDNKDAVPWQPGCEPLTARIRSTDSHDAVFWQPGCGAYSWRWPNNNTIGLISRVYWEMHLVQPRLHPRKAQLHLSAHSLVLKISTNMIYWGNLGTILAQLNVFSGRCILSNQGYTHGKRGVSLPHTTWWLKMGRWRFSCFQWVEREKDITDISVGILFQQT